MALNPKTAEKLAKKHKEEHGEAAGKKLGFRGIGAAVEDDTPVIVLYDDEQHPVPDDPKE